MTVSPEGRQFIERHEGCRLVSYRDGAGIWTIGYGHTNGVHADMMITQEKADEWLGEDLGVAEGAISAHVTATLAQNQYDALASFIFNVGAGAFATSTLLRMVNAGDYEGAGAQFGRWVHDAAGNVEPGLVTRRADEANLFLTGAYS